MVGSGIDVFVGVVTTGSGDVGVGEGVGGGLVGGGVETVGTDTGVPQCHPPLVLHTVTLTSVGVVEVPVCN